MLLTLSLSAWGSSRLSTSYGATTTLLRRPMLHHEVLHENQQPGFINLCLTMIHQLGRTELEPSLTLSRYSQGDERS